jgi:transcriptional regulator with XRE-family HTH domain
VSENKIKLFMNEIGEKIKELRKKKGLSQEELAELANVNLRTIQRIENNGNEPRGHTLNQICKVLDVSAEEILDYGKQIDYNFLFYFHLSVISFIVIPLGNIIIPMILWQTKKEKIIGLKEVGANLLSFQIIWTVLYFLSILTFTLLKILRINSYYLIFYIFIGLCALNIILPIYFAYNSKKGKIEKRYPKIFKIIK